MRFDEIAGYRLKSQGLADGRFRSAAESVAWLGASQAQEYALAKWALGLRIAGSRDGDIEQAVTDGSILRTHLMRPTWHFVSAADIRWLLVLTGPRVHAGSASRYRDLELDERTRQRSDGLLADALRGGQQRTRAELSAVLNQAGIGTEGQRLAYLLMNAELNGVMCSGARQGKQHTYALLEERVPPAAALSREESVAEIVRRFFTSHGPVQLVDFAWWSGLTQADARAGIEALGGEIVQHKIDGKTYWGAAAPAPAKHPDNSEMLLLPPYDEYTGSLRDRSAIVNLEFPLIDLEILPGMIALDGKLIGSWRRTILPRQVRIEMAPFRPFSPAESDAFAAQAERFAEFVGLPLALIEPGQT